MFGADVFPSSRFDSGGVICHHPGFTDSSRRAASQVCLRRKRWANLKPALVLPVYWDLRWLNEFATTHLLGGGGGGGLGNWTNDLFTFLSAELHFAHTLPQAKKFQVYKVGSQSRPSIVLIWRLTL